ncbi:AraC family transcriptional regulator [Bacteroidales bacterium OttesenSCG-928-M06]|nr:AraC family transcriptional regulator [Bacteroidales bacterium OttesenSCG-928-M06]
MKPEYENFYFKDKYELYRARIVIPEYNISRGKVYLYYVLTYVLYENGKEEIFLVNPHLPFQLPTKQEGAKDIIQIVFNDSFCEFVQPSVFYSIQNLLSQTKKGFYFHSNVVCNLKQIIYNVISGDNVSNLCELLSLLECLALSKERTVLSESSFLLKYDSSKYTQQFLKIEMLKRYIHERSKENITLKSAANYLGMTSEGLSRLCKKYFQEGFSGYILRVRITHAQQMLRNTSYNILYISLECGFNTFSHFNAKFKQIAGVTPGEYRKRNKL